VKKVTTTTRMVIAINKVGEVKSQWLEAIGSLRVSIWGRALHVGVKIFDD
jgi:hypothetical protein